MHPDFASCNDTIIKFTFLPINLTIIWNNNTTRLFMSLMVSISGIRGVVGEDLTPPVIMDFVSSFASLLKKPWKSIIVGRDTRESGKFIEKIVEGTLIALGFEVINIGIAATPTILLMTRKMDCNGGIAITASHNPSGWNALKFCDKNGLFFNEDHVSRIEELVKHHKILPETWKGFDKLGAAFSESTAYLIHINEVLKGIDHELIKRKGFKVAIDPGGGASSVIDKAFLKKLGCTVVGIHDQSDGLQAGRQFPRGLEPIPENLTGLCKLVRSSGADIGFAQDPDGDRLAVVSESGKAIGEEYTLILAGKAYLRRKKTDMVCNLSSSMMIDDLARRHGVCVHRTKIGEIHVTTKLLKENLLFGGEGNGGVIVPEINPCRDSIIAMGLILELLATTEKTVSQLINEFPTYIIKKGIIEIAEMDKDNLFINIHKKAREHFSDYIINNIDGIKIYNNSEWLHIRPSNTEPVIRIMAESTDENRTDELLRIGRSFFSTCRDNS